MRSSLIALLLVLASPSISLAQGEEYEQEAVGGPEYEAEAVGAEAVEAAEEHGVQQDEGVAGEMHTTTVVHEDGEHAAAEHGEHGAAEHGEHGEEGHGAGAHGEGHDASINMLELSGSFVNFGIWLALLVLMLRKPLSEFLRNRRASVVEGMEEAKRVKEEAEAKHREYSERIENLDAELERLRDEMRRAGQEERERIVAAANDKAAKMREEARFLVDQQMKQLRVDLTREAVEAAVATAEALLTKQTSAADQERLANDYLATLKASLKQKIEEKRL